MKSNRRRFFAASASVITPAVIAGSSVADGTAPPSERINIGVIGLGSRGYNLIDALLKSADAQIVAICDVDMHHYRDRAWGQGTAFGLLPAKEKIESAYAKKKSGKPQSGLSTYSDFRELIGRDQHRRGGCGHARSLARDLYAECTSRG